MYIVRPSEAAALAALKIQRNEGLRAALLLGPPGSGKTEFTRHVAEELGAQYVYALLHSWTDDQELFAGIDVASAVAGNSESVRQPGVLAVAAEKSRQGATVLCLDEIDKVPERTEYLLLDLRMRRVRMQPLAGDQLAELVARRAEVPVGFARLIIRGARRAGTDDLSAQELAAAASDVWHVATDYDQARLMFSQWVSRSGSLVDRKSLDAAWGERKKACRAAESAEEVRPWL